MPAVELRISVDEEGKVSVSGPIGQKGLCYQMLECARDAIKDHTDALAKQGNTTIVPPTNGDVLNFTRKG
jgi:hypothetical protein